MELLTIHEAAQMLKVNPITIRRYIADGRLAAVRVGKRIRVRKDSLERFIQPVEPKIGQRQASVRRGKPTNAEDPLWHIVGIGHSKGPTDVSENKHKYLAEAYAAEAE